MKKQNTWLIVLLILVVAGAAMVVTCPSGQAHKNKLAQMVNTSVKEAVSQDIGTGGDDLLSKGLQMVGSTLISKAVDSAVENMLQVDNYILCSIGRVEYQGDSHIVSVGLLGHVFSANQDKLNEATKRQYISICDRAVGDVRSKVREAIAPLTDKLKETISGEVGNILREVITGEEPEDDEE